ncbi:CLUMA_CG008747, isoform A [Clunio marinus]|uniref:CLUMA_CG008747, isoform A n=1 Tax=Clunio marinus TaxID=568069 RepID=A0A1J1I6X7_9DIPT|nr:CLUMA_CG008747, isoform A [Clunio marinus]
MNTTPCMYDTKQDNERKKNLNIKSKRTHTIALTTQKVAYMLLLLIFAQNSFHVLPCLLLCVSFLMLRLVNDSIYSNQKGITGSREQKKTNLVECIALGRGANSPDGLKFANFVSFYFLDVD